MNILDKKDRSVTPVYGMNGVTTNVAEKFSWAKSSTPGEFRMIDKRMLNIDDSYQRDQTSHDKVLRIARAWDWSIFGCLGVAEREDGTLWVYDGGHRARASFYRQEINKLPCMVFRLGDISDEARAFIGGARLSTNISSFDTFRASKAAKEPDAIATSELLESLGIEATKHASKPSHLKGVHTIQAAVKVDPELAERALKIALSITGNCPVSATVVKAIFDLAHHFPERDILAEHEEELCSLTQVIVLKAMQTLRAETGKGGWAINAKALMLLLNKGKRTRKLVW